MANRYEKLDQFLDEAFRGSPNTLEASETKIEIITNLRQMYDELIQSGLSEEEALTKTCDSLGNPAEIFGSMESRFDTNEQEQPTGSQSTAQTKRSAHPPKPPVSPFRSLVITIGVLLCALCWLPTAILAVNVDADGWIATPILPMVALGVFCFIYAGSMRMGASSKTKLHYFFIGLGVACEIACAFPTILFTENETLGVSLLLTLVGVGVVLIVLGAMIPTDKWDSGEEVRKKPKSPLEKSIILITLAVYLLLSFITGAWEVTWLIWLIGSAVRTLISAIGDLKSEEGSGET